MSEALRFLLISLLLPLYTRLNGRDIETDIRQHSIRGRIFQCVADHPGANFTEIMKKVSAGNGTTVYHLTILEREGYIKSSASGNHRLFWTRREYPGAEDATLTQIQKEILGYLEEEQQLTRKQLLTRTQISRSTLHFNIRQLVKMGVVKEEKKGREHYCFLK